MSLQVFMPLVVLIISVLYTNDRNKKLDVQSKMLASQQREQHIKDLFIKRENEILLKILKDSEDIFQSGIYFFDIFSIRKMPLYFYNMPDKRIPGSRCPKEINIEEYIAHYKNLRDFYDLYIKERVIFQKHDIDIIVNYLIPIIATMSKLTRKNDFIWEMIASDEESESYSIINRQFLITRFIEHIRLSEQSEIDSNYEYVFNEADFEKYRDIITNELQRFIFDIRELTTYFPEGMPDKCLQMCKLYFDTPEELKNIIENGYNFEKSK